MNILMDDLMSALNKFVDLFSYYGKNNWESTYNENVRSRTWI